MNEESIFPIVAIIMSAYNAEKFIVEQTNSILEQVGVTVNIWIRNDGSTDGTLTLLKSRFGADTRVKITTGSNLGACGSFIEAFFSCDLEFDFIGFSDADDVWLPTKLRDSVELLSTVSSSSPVAIATRLNVVDQVLTHIAYTKKPRVGFIFENALVQTVASGATIVLNRSAAELVRSNRPSHAAMHDSWVYLVLTAFGTVLFLDQPTVLYRQHANNVYGTAHSFQKRVRNRLSKLRKRSVFHRQAAEFFNLFGSKLSDHKREIIKSYLEYPTQLQKRLSFALRPTVKKQGKLSNLFMRVLILCGTE